MRAGQPRRFVLPALTLTLVVLLGLVPALSGATPAPGPVVAAPLTGGLAPSGVRPPRSPRPLSSAALAASVAAAASASARVIASDAAASVVAQASASARVIASDRAVASSASQASASAQAFNQPPVPLTGEAARAQITSNPTIISLYAYVWEPEGDEILFRADSTTCPSVIGSGSSTLYVYTDDSISSCQVVYSVRDAYHDWVQGTVTFIRTGP
jgi:hypothetical protein